MNIKQLILAGAVGIAAITTVQATPIVGSIGFGGSFLQNGGTAGQLNTATSFSIPDPSGAPLAIQSTTGAFVGATTPTFLSPINENGSGLNGSQLWSVKVGSTTYSLLITSWGQTLNSVSQVDFVGNGTLRDGNSADDTAGTWQLQFGQTGSSLLFTSTSANNVPDGGATVMLLGAALSAMGLLRRKLIA